MARHGLYVGRVLRFVSEGLAKASNGEVDAQLVIDVCSRRPEPVAQLVATDDLARARKKQFQQASGLWLEPDRDPVSHQTGRISHELVLAEAVGPSGGSLARERHRNGAG